MDNQIRARLELSKNKGAEMQRVLDTYIKPFIEEKERVLFQAFRDTQADNVEQLKDIKFQATAIASLESYFKSFVDDGRLAEHQLENDQ